ncbi:undecaprenyl/decaprenyl-phosphate alpha-N-acetylglucosaminyl 1-phosphate transferase [Dyella flava]|uniref:Undecaprenyl/decaprenyl-phosphate alpha-N-acetylglucosaminyl 1-phosphate transferase n=1 Tax=Dyella flava TaxID=1920170 RepID=A0ABS2JYE1_9GAMM|nr:undecaprenyl/decaprenyl-phosphate alpha-N-acetylglucosaminyl 1-phosphate transferase [Dyella flava]MBM7124001.1 undecaprenyl/decaprenyl-phosphate alpha-N-acetylglucosaminyl 1-phosphate transferase [Dyella flava]GLQ50552.1 undecaprenyl-phosphate alpha-N-acetylglucosaminyl 1-phosphate transferase [Dyella flava]
MQDASLVLACAIAAVVSFSAIGILRRFAEPLGLVDRPNERKHHVGNIPLIGGLAIFLGVVIGAWWLGYFNVYPRVRIIMETAAVLALIGALDDRHDLSVESRLVVQVAAILTVIASTGLYIESLGHLFGHQLHLGLAGIPFTVFAVIGLLNAFNMMDGIDGLAGGLCLVSVCTIVLFSDSFGSRGFMNITILLAAAVLPYLAWNLGFFGRKIFMGDAGSMVIGYLLAWALISASQHPSHHLSPVDVLWCVALPVLDTIAVMYRRMRNGKSPFKADRGHIHHILLSASLSARRTLLCLIALAGALAFLGSVVRLFGSAASLLTFCGLMGVYVLLTARISTRQEARKVIAQSAFVAANDADIGPSGKVMPQRTPMSCPQPEAIAEDS